MKSSFLVTYLILGVSLSCAEDFSLDKALTKLDITPDVFEKLVNGSRTVKRDTITNLLKKQLNKQGLILDVTPAEVRLSQNLPNQCQDTTSCGCRVESRDVQVFAAIQRTSNLTTSGKAFEDAGIIIGKSSSMNMIFYMPFFQRPLLMQNLGQAVIFVQKEILEI